IYFFNEEDGIRVFHVTGVQTCALPILTCSARLPVYALIIAAFIPEQTVWGIFNLQGLTLFGLYMAGIISASLVAWMMRRRQTREEYPLLLELPTYRWPMAYHVLLGLRERTWIFLQIGRAHV